MGILHQNEGLNALTESELTEKLLHTILVKVIPQDVEQDFQIAKRALGIGRYVSVTDSEELR